MRTIVFESNSNSTAWSTCPSTIRTTACTLYVRQSYFEMISPTVSDPMTERHWYAQKVQERILLPIQDNEITKLMGQGTCLLHSALTKGNTFIVRRVRGCARRVSWDVIERCVTMGRECAWSNMYIERAPPHNNPVNEHTSAIKRWVYWKEKPWTKLAWEMFGYHELQLQVRTEPCIPVPSSRRGGVQGNPLLGAETIMQTPRGSRRWRLRSDGLEDWYT